MEQQLHSMKKNAPHSDRAIRASRANCRLLVLLLVMLMGPAIQLVAQPVSTEMRIVVREDNQSVYIYHTALPPISHGFNIYRKAAGREVFTKLNSNPIRGVASGAELRAYLGTLYDDIELVTGQNTANSTLTKLRSDTRTANLLTFTYPKIAESLGRLYIDTTADMETAVTYRIEFVDALDAPVGSPIEKTVLLLPQKPDAPAQLRAQNQGNQVTLFWRFVPANENVDDKVIRFEAFRIDPTTNQHQRLNENIILRNNALFEYALTFEVPTIGQTEQLYVRSIDISGQTSEPSPTLRYNALDVDPPNTIIDVTAQPVSNNRILINWSVSDLNDIAGFHIYRSGEISNEASYVRLNRHLLSLNETTFSDTLNADHMNSVLYYRMAAVDANGNASLMSTAAMALVQDQKAPPPAFDLTASYDEGMVQLTWQHEDAPSDFRSFIVLRRELDVDAAPMPIRVNIEDVTGRSYKDAGIAGLGFTEGARYRYSILAADQAGNFSNPVHIDLRIPDITAPVAPNGAQAIIDTPSRVALFWNPSPSQDVMSYIVYRRASGSTSLSVHPVPWNQRRFEDLEVEPGTTYEYWITAADSAGNESIKSENAVLTMRDYLPPRQARNLQAMRSDDDAAVLNWEPVPALDLAGYRIERAATTSGNYRPAHEALITTPYWTDTETRSAQCYRVFADDTSGNESRPGLAACVEASLSQ